MCVDISRGEVGLFLGGLMRVYGIEAKAARYGRGFLDVVAQAVRS